jgi:hypothetical protein
MLMSLFEGIHSIGFVTLITVARNTSFFDIFRRTSIYELPLAPFCNISLRPVHAKNRQRRTTLCDALPPRANSTDLLRTGDSHSIDAVIGDLLDKELIRETAVEVDRLTSLHGLCIEARMGRSVASIPEVVNAPTCFQALRRHQSDDIVRVDVPGVVANIHSTVFRAAQRNVYVEGHSLVDGRAKQKLLWPLKN